MTLYYVDTSVALHVLAGHEAALSWFEDVAEHDELISSRLLQTEMTRVLRRDGRPVLDRYEVLNFIALVPINETVLNRAESIQSHIRTLDAIHLATAELIGNVTVATHDKQMKAVAQDLAIRTVDPVFSG